MAWGSGQAREIGVESPFERRRKVIANPATANDFAKWEREAKRLSIDSLRYVINDCQEAARAMKGWNPEREGYYIDQASTFGQELTKRTK